MDGERAEDRSVLAIGGADRTRFLQGLITRDPVPGGLAYAALLTPQGKYMADFFVLDRAEDILLDVPAPLAQGLLQRLTMYRLRADVTLETTEIAVARGVGPCPDGAFADPRHPSLGWRAYGVDGGAAQVDWDALRVAACIPEFGAELQPNDTYILEAGFERIGGVDHRKGCYVGQEVTARMKHKTTLRKGFVTVDVQGAAEPGAAIEAGGREVGRITTRAGDQAIAYLRFDRAAPMMQAGEAQVTWAGTDAA